MPNPAKKPGLMSEEKGGVKEDKESSLLNLDPDALLRVLTRTAAQDHNNLRLTCKALRDILNSQKFRVERALSGWAEARTTLVTPQELCKEEHGDDSDDSSTDWLGEYYGDIGRRDPDYGYQEIEAKIWVDGKLGGRAKVTIVPRPPGTKIFHEICDAISGELQELGCQFCDTKGKPRLACVKETGRDASTGGFAYITKFELHPEHRQASNVAAQALRSLLCNTRLSGRWTIATYIADAEAHFTREDRAKNDARRMGQREDFLSRLRAEAQGGRSERNVKDKEADNEWKDRWNAFAKHDTRLFLRAGFQQVKELAATNDYYTVFAVPSFLTGNMMSHEEALSIDIAQKPVLPEEPTGANAELLDLFVRACSDRVKLQSYMDATRKDALDSADKAQAALDEASSPLENQELDDDTRAERNRLMEAGRALIDRLRANADQAEDRTRAGMNELDNLIRAEVARLTGEAAATVEKSHALHCCACNLLPEYLDLLLEFVPAPKRSDAINGLDHNGRTPLMVAASMFPDNEERSFSICDKIIDLGGDRKITDPPGKTALGCMRSVVRGMHDFRNAFGIRKPKEKLEAEIAMLSRMETLLMPPLVGATEADNAVAIDVDSDEDSDLDDMLGSDGEEEEGEDET